LEKGIVVFAFGAPHTTAANRRLATVAHRWARLMYASIFTQTAIQFEASSEPIDVSYCQERRGNPLSTLRIAREAAKWAAVNQIHEMWIIAAPSHMWRCNRDIRYAMREVRAWTNVKVYGDVDQRVGFRWYCPESTPKWARSWKAWWLRECLIRCVPMWLYNRVAS